MAGTIARGAVVHRPDGIRRSNVAITTDASGDATATTVVAGFGRFVGFMYDGGLDASAVITIKDALTGATLFTYTTGTEGTATSVAPTGIIVDVAGASIAGHANNPNVNRAIYFGGKVTVTVASGGNAETGLISLIVNENDEAPLVQ